MAYADSWSAFNCAIQQTQTPKVFGYVNSLPADRYACLAVKTSRYGHESSNTVETMNGQLVELRERPIIELLEGIWDKQMKHFERRHQEALLWPSQSRFPFTPQAIKWFAVQQQASNKYRMVLSSQDSSLVPAKVTLRTSSLVDAAQQEVNISLQHLTGEYNRNVADPKHTGLSPAKRSPPKSPLLGIYWIDGK